MNLKIVVLSLIFVVLSCERQKEVPSKNNFLNTVVPEKSENLKNLSFDDLDKISKSIAIEKYGQPTSQERFVLDDMQGEFRNGINDSYNKEIRLSEKIVIDELTWEKDKETWVTVWYEVSEGEMMSKDLFVWEKGSEF